MKLITLRALWLNSLRKRRNTGTTIRVRISCSWRSRSRRRSRRMKHVFQHKKITKLTARRIVGDDNRTIRALHVLRDGNVLRTEGAKRGATWVFTDKWVYHDHEVVGA